MESVNNKRVASEKRVAYFGVFTALAVIFSYVESLIPFYMGIPGAKLGLANLVIVIVLYFLGAKEAVVLSVIRILIIGFMFGNLFTILYSLAGTLLSLAGMYLLKKTGKFSIVGVSIVGGVLHNIGQFVIALWIMETKGLFYYLPFLLVIGAFTGLLIGIVSNEVQKRLKKIKKDRE